MKYTTSKEADKKVEEDLRIIVEEIIKSIPDTISIFLTGGFARGEGPVKKIKGKFFPYNDYDIQIVCKNKISKDKIDMISTKISRTLGYNGIAIFYPFKKEEQKMKENFYVDLKSYIPNELKKLLPRIRNYELKNNSLLIYGEDVRFLIPDYKINEIPLSEGAKLLLDRMSQMIEYYSTNKKYDSEFLTYIIQQTYAACCTSLLLLNKKYQIGYEKSMKILKENYKRDFPELYYEMPNLDKKIEQFIKWKINPQKLPNKDVKKEWFIAKKNILEVAKYFFSRFLNKDVRNVERLSENILNMRNEFYGPYLKWIIKDKIKIDFNYYKLFLPFVSLVLKYKYYKRLRKFGINMPKVIFGKSPDLVIFSSLIYILNSINENNIDNLELKKGKEILNSVYPCKEDNWEKISLDYANAYIIFFLQKL